MRKDGIITKYLILECNDTNVNIIVLTGITHQYIDLGFLQRASFRVDSIVERTPNLLLSINKRESVLKTHTLFQDTIEEREPMKRRSINELTCLRNECFDYEHSL